MKTLKRVLGCQSFMLKRMYRDSKRLFYVTLIQSILAGMYPTIELVISRNLIDSLVRLSLRDAIISIALLIGSSLLYYVLKKLLSLIAANSYQLIRRQMRFDLFEKTCSLDLAVADLPENRTLYEEAHGANQNNRCMRVLDSFFSIFTACITLISSYIVMIAVDPWIMIVIVAVVILQSFITIRSQKLAYETWREDARTNKEASYVLGLLFDRNCAFEMRLHNLSQWVIRKYNKVQTKSDQLWLENNKKQQRNDVLNFAVQLVQKAILYVYLALQMLYANMTIANFTLCFNSLNQISNNLVALIRTFIDIFEDSKYIYSYKKYLALENTIAVHRPDEKPVARNEARNNEIVFDHVSFRYPEAPADVLHDINLHLEPQKFYVIVGANGAGKTTLINLLMRLYDPSSGSIRLGPTDIRDYDFQSYRDCFGAVFQNFKVFDYSFFENITLSEEENEEIDAEVQQVIQKAGLANKVSQLAKGMHTCVGKAFDQDGIKLSGGEYQKVALARALYRDSQILILDEPSSALDALAEDDLIQTFQRASTNQTVFYISHRLSVARFAYRVIFIGNHTILGYGSHDELMQTCPQYAEMYTAQAKYYTETETAPSH